MSYCSKLLKGLPMFRFYTGLSIALLCCCSMPILAEQTPPIMPKIEETPLPSPVEIGSPSSIPADVPNKPLTVTEAVSIALHHQPSIAIAGASVTAAQGREQQTRAGLYPTLTTGFSRSHVSIEKGKATSTPEYSVTASLRQLLFDFNHTRDLVRQTEALQKSAKANLTRTQSDLALQVKQAFYTLVQNKRLVDVNQTNLQNRRSHVELAKARLDGGIGLPLDVVRAETAVSEAVLSLNQAQTNVTASRISLAQLMGIDPRTPILVSDSEEAAVVPGELNNLVDKALKNRPEISQAKANIDASRYSVSAARTSNAPTISGTAGWNNWGDDIPLDNDSLILGVSVQFTPFDSGLTAGRVKEAKANLTSSQAQFENTKLSVISDVSQAYLNVQTAQQRVDTSNSEVSNAAESLRLAQGRYQAGLGIFLDVLDAQSALVTAQSNRVNALSALEQAKAALEHAVGVS